jgi:hypothetical protein
MAAPDPTVPTIANVEHTTADMAAIFNIVFIVSLLW